MGDSQDYQNDAREGASVPAEMDVSDFMPLDTPDPGTEIAPDSEPIEHDPEIADVVASLDVAHAEGSEHDPELAALQADLAAEAVVDASADDDQHPEIAETPAEAETVADESKALPAPDDTAEGGPAEAPEAVAVQDGAEGSTEAGEDAADIGAPADRAGVPLWPFLVYLAIWLVFSGVLVWQSLMAPTGTPIYEIVVYRYSILVGLILTAIGPLLAIGVWLAVWTNHPSSRKGLFSRSFIIGAVTTMAGVLVWLVALGILDTMRLGRAF